MGRVMNEGPQTEVNHKTIMKGSAPSNPCRGAHTAAGDHSGRVFEKRRLSENQNHGSMTQILPFKFFSKIRTK